MRILQICNGFADSKVHSNLCKKIDTFGVLQVVYCPVRDKNHIGKNRFGGDRIKIIYSHCIKKWYKYVYHYKRWMLYRDLKKQVDISNFDLIHAPTLFSDGGLALKAYREYGIPYFVAVRNTDINIYMRPILSHTHYTGREIALNASRIFFISKAEMNEFVNSPMIKPILSRIKSKLCLQPNGIDDYWHKHINTNQRNGRAVLYIGDFSPNKNIRRVVDAIIKLRNQQKFADVKLIIVGGGKERGNSMHKIIESYPDIIDYRGQIFDKDILLEIMRSSALFVMPSIHETFGLVYLEALSQNLPVIYSKGQGIDGYFDDSIGIGVNPLSVEEIKEAISTILLNPTNYSNKKVDFNLFNWNIIAEQYMNRYKEIIGE